MPLLQRVQLEEPGLNPEVLGKLSVMDIQNKLNVALPELQKRDQVIQILESHGCGLDATIGELVTILKFTDNEAIKLRAIERSLEMHGALNAKENAQATVVNFVIQDATVNIANILQPQR